MRYSFGVVAAVAAIVLAAGCSSSSSPQAAGTTPAPNGGTTAATTAGNPSSAPSAPNSTSPQAGGGASASSAGSNTSVPNGKQLAALFAGVTPPSGYTLVPSGATDSGPDPVQDPGSYIGLNACTDLTNSSADTIVSDYQSADAENTIRDANQNEVDVLVAAYTPGNADKQWKEVSDMYARCATYQSDVFGGGTTTLKTTSTPVSGVGDHAVDLKIQATTAGYVSEHTLLVRVGDRIIAVSSSSQEAASIDLQPYAKAYLPALSK